eukprot:s3542_g3.t2
MDSLRTLVRNTQAIANWQPREALPLGCSPDLATSANLRSDELLFSDFERLVEQDVEALKGEVDPPRVSVSVPLCELPTALRDPFEASSCCRAAVHLLSLLCNQSEHLSQSAMTRFALIARLMTQVLPMPLPLDHPAKESRCFWMQEMKHETKADLMRHLFLIARHFAAACFTLRARRDTDGARVVVSAALAAVMDALLRRCLTDSLHGSLASRHYAGLAQGPCQPFGVEPGAFQAASETLLLVAPEYQALRTLVLDYFDSVSRCVAEDHMIFSFDKTMTCSAGDTALVEQIGLCLGLDAARREAPLLLTGERPELFELFPELAWFRDTVFLWKMLLLPECQCPVVQKWSASDSLLKWHYRKGRFEVVGFGTNLTPEVNGKPSGFLRGVLRWFGQYESDKKSLSRASPSVLTGDPSQQLATEDDVLFLKQLPTFNGVVKLSSLKAFHSSHKKLGKHQPTYWTVMDDWDPFADPADAPAPPTRPAPPVHVAVPKPDAVPVEPEATGGDIPDLPSLAELEQQLQKVQLESCPELVQAAFAGDEAKVQELLKGGADPNTIWLREERLKGSDGCCQCAISWEEYTALIAACMELKTDICELLLLHDQTDMNVVCCGLHEFGPYKHFTVLDCADMAKQVQSPLMEKLLAKGAKPAAKCPTPPWPREPQGADDSDDALPAPTATALPGLPSAKGPYAELVDAMRQNRCKSLELRQRLFKQMMLEWHPDKRPASERSLATAALGAADVELLLSYLTAPYLRIPLLLGFFTDRHRASALREPQLQVVLDAALFEPGQWQPPMDLLKSPPDTVPAPDRRHLATAAGLLFNELMRSPQAVVHAVLCLLQVAIEKDVGRPDSANDGLILYVIRLATRIESYLAFLVSHGRRGAYLERSGASYDAFVRSLAGPKDEALLMELQAAHREIRTQLQGDVLRMLKDWLRYTSKRPPGKFLAAACRIHAHIALIFKNVPELDTAAVSGFLSAQAFLNINHRLEDTSASSGEAGRLGVGEVELFDAFESRRSRITLWLREDSARASLVLRMVEQAVTNRGKASSEVSAEEWGELRPGDFVPKKHLPSESWFKSQPGEAFHEWMLRTTQGGAAGRQVSINLGQYGTKRDGLELLPSWAVCSPDYLEAFGRSDVHCVEREVAAKRDWKDLVGHAGFSIQRWHPEEHQDPHAQAHSGSIEAWALQLLQPVLSALPGLNEFELQMRCQVPPEANELWLNALRADGTKSRKELRVQRQPALVEVYNILEHGRHFYRTMVFTSDTSWSFHVPSAGQRLLRNAGSFAWSVAAGDGDAAVGSSASNHFSVLVLRNSQIHLPRRFLRGLLPDALLQRYRFWRCRGSNSAAKGGVGEIEGEEVMPSKDEATRLRIQLVRTAEGTTARVERRPVEEPNAAPEVLVNLRRGNGLTKILARLENLSHILVWAGQSLRVELPRLRLSFAAQKQRLYCEQHRGFWLADGALQDMTQAEMGEESVGVSVADLLAQWGVGLRLTLCWDAKRWWCRKILRISSDDALPGSNGHF